MVTVYTILLLVLSVGKYQIGDEWWYTYVGTI